jgi:sulfite reductase alpha subunit-like flavoprotein
VDTQFNNLPSEQDDLNQKSAIQALETLFHHTQQLSPSPNTVKKILLSMPLLRPRYYSIASPNYNSHTIGENISLGVLFRIIPNGRFSHHCIT